MAASFVFHRSSYVLVGLSLLGYCSLHSLLSYITEGCYLHKSPSQCCDVSLSKEDGWLKILHVLLPLLTLQKYMPSLLVSALLSCSSTLFICNDTPQNLLDNLFTLFFLFTGWNFCTNKSFNLFTPVVSFPHTHKNGCISKCALTLPYKFYHTQDISRSYATSYYVQSSTYFHIHHISCHFSHKSCIINLLPMCPQGLSPISNVIPSLSFFLTPSSLLPPSPGP